MEVQEIIDLFKKNLKVLVDAGMNEEQILFMSKNPELLRKQIGRHLEDFESTSIHMREDSQKKKTLQEAARILRVMLQ